MLETISLAFSSMLSLLVGIFARRESARNAPGVVVSSMPLAGLNHLSNDASTRAISSVDVGQEGGGAMGPAACINCAGGTIASSVGVMAVTAATVVLLVPIGVRAIFEAALKAAGVVLVASAEEVSWRAAIGPAACKVAAAAIFFSFKRGLWRIGLPPVAAEAPALLLVTGVRASLEVALNAAGVVVNVSPLRIVSPEVIGWFGSSLSLVTT